MEQKVTEGDVQAGIEFIYHMREHLVDVGIATAYLFACYAIYLLMKKYIKWGETDVWIQIKDIKRMMHCNNVYNKPIYLTKKKDRMFSLKIIKEWTEFDSF